MGREATMSLRNNAPLLPALAEGSHDATLSAFTYFPATETASDGYALQIKLSDRIITERKFDQSFTISISHLRKQLGDDSIIAPKLDKDGNLVSTSSELFLKNLMDKATPFKIYVETVEVTRRNGNVSNQRNINFLPPLTKAKSAELVITNLDDGEIVVD